MDMENIFIQTELYMKENLPKENFTAKENLFILTEYIYELNQHNFYQDTYSATWNRGILVDGDFNFKDNLKYKPENWDYCLKDDRRFYHEELEEIETHTTVHLPHVKKL